MGVSVRKNSLFLIVRVGDMLHPDGSLALVIFFGKRQLNVYVIGVRAVPVPNTSWDYDCISRHNDPRRPRLPAESGPPPTVRAASVRSCACAMRVRPPGANVTRNARSFDGSSPTTISSCHTWPVKLLAKARLLERVPARMIFISVPSFEFDPLDATNHVLRL